MSYKYDYTLEFVNVGNIHVITSCGSPDRKNQELLDLVSDELSSLINVTRIYPTIKNISSFVCFNDKVYKIIFYKDDSCIIKKFSFVNMFFALGVTCHYYPFK